MKVQRVQKLIAGAGLCSRRKAEALVTAGRVKVDGKIASLGDLVDPIKQLIHVDGSILLMKIDFTVLLLNKPQGVISSCYDPFGRKIVMELLPPKLRIGMHPIGRLDSHTRGALLITDNGELTQSLTHPSYNHSKTYRVWVVGKPDQTTINRWRNGIMLDGKKTRPARVELIQLGSRSLLEIELKEGRNRQIRRMAEIFGHPVVDLQRTMICGLSLGDLSEGSWRILRKQEWISLITAKDMDW